MNKMLSIEECETDAISVFIKNEDADALENEVDELLSILEEL